MENQNNNLQELEELRSQVAEFKKRVEQQEIVSRRLLREAMKGHVSWIKQMSIWGSVGELVILPFFSLRFKKYRRRFMATNYCNRAYVSL